MKPSTCQGYDSNVRAHLKVAFGPLALQTIREDTVQGYLASALKSGAKPKSVKNHLITLKTMFAAAVKWGYLTSSPAGMFRSSVPPSPACGKGSNSPSGWATWTSITAKGVCGGRSRGSASSNGATARGISVGRPRVPRASARCTSPELLRRPPTLRGGPAGPGPGAAAFRHADRDTPGPAERGGADLQPSRAGGAAVGVCLHRGSVGQLTQRSEDEFIPSVEHATQRNSSRCRAEGLDCFRRLAGVSFDLDRVET